MTESNSQRKKRLAREFNENRDKPRTERKRVVLNNQSYVDTPEAKQARKRHTKASRHFSSSRHAMLMAAVSVMSQNQK